MPVQVSASAQDAARRAAALRRLVGTVAAACLALHLVGCAVVQRDVPRPETHAWADPAQTARGQAAATQLSAHRDASGFHLLDSGLDGQGGAPARAYRVMLPADKAASNALVWTAEDDGKVVRHDEKPASLSRRLLSELLHLFTPDDLL